MIRLWHGVEFVDYVESADGVVETLAGDVETVDGIVEFGGDVEIAFGGDIVPGL